MGQRIERYNKDGLYDVVDTRKVEEEKAERIESMKSNVINILSKTDWMVIRLSERGIAIPDDTAKKRLEIIRTLDEVENNLKAINTLEEYDKFHGYHDFHQAIKALE